MSLSVCLLLDVAADRAVRRLWRRLEDDGVPTLLSHTHGRHVPHLTLASLLSYDLAEVRRALQSLPAEPETRLQFDALGMFRRSRCWLLPGVSSAFLARQEAVIAALAGTSAELHRHYRPGEWLPHLTLAPRLHLDQLAVVAGRVYEVLPLATTVSTISLVETGTGTVHDLGQAG
jgi:2'-5' RNA ligase